MRARPRAQLLLPMRNRQAFLEQHFQKGEAGGLFVPGDLEVELGDEVDVELHFAEEQVRFHIRAQVKWKRQNAGRRSIPPGVGIEFLAMDRATEQQILRFAEGKESVSHVERERRFAVQMDVRVEGPRGMELEGTTDDVSEGGCFVVTDVNLDVGTPVVARLKVPGALFGRLKLPAVVAWRREQTTRSGMGLQFQFETDRQRQKMHKALALLKERMLRDLQVKTPKLRA
jgi:Tfp pilus assembly protein PilZ